MAQELLNHEILVPTPLGSKMQAQFDLAWVRLGQRVRRRIETVISQLVERFDLEQVRTRDMWHLSSRLNRKLLAHTVCFWLNLIALSRYSLMD